MSASGTGTFFDGITGARRDVAIDLAPVALRIVAASGETLAEWPYTEIERLSAPNNVLRLGRKGSDVLARLEIRDPALMAAIGDHSSAVDPGAVSERGERGRVVARSLAAVVSLVPDRAFGSADLAPRAASCHPLGVQRQLHG